MGGLARERICLVLVIVAGALGLISTAAKAARTVQLLAPGGGQIRALVVGINQYSGAAIPTLKGAVADARDIEATLRSAGVVELTVLIDGDATRRNVEVAMNGLVDSSKQGDLVIISFAGHGAQEPELIKGSEADGMDEIFLLAGFSRSGPGTKERIIDDEIHAWLSRIEKKGAEILFVADTCHGGGMLRQPDFRAGELSYRWAGTVSLVDDSLKPISTEADAGLTINDMPNVTFLGAVDKFSKSPEVKVPDNATLRGALSYAVARAIEKGLDGVVTREMLFGFARQIAYQYSETRQVIATEPTGKLAKLEKVVFRLKASGTIDDVETQEPIKLRITGGSEAELAGISPHDFNFRVVTSGENPDITWDISKGEVLNSYGDIIAKCSSSEQIPAIVDGVGSISAIDKLAEGGSQRVKLLPNDGRFHNGDIVSFRIAGVSGKFLILVNLSGDGMVRFLFPREKSDAPLISEESFNLPLRVSEPFGSDHIIAIVSDKRLDEVEAGLSSLDGQKAAGKLLKILRPATLGGRGARLGVAGLFTGQ